MRTVCAERIADPSSIRSREVTKVSAGETRIAPFDTFS